MRHRLFFDTNIFLNVILEEKDCISCTKLLDAWNKGLSPCVERADASAFIPRLKSWVFPR